MFHLSNGIAGFGFWKSQFGKKKPFSNMRAALIIATTPLAPSKWPMFDFKEPMYSGYLESEERPKTAPIAAASIGSPTAVPYQINQWSLFTATCMDGAPTSSVAFYVFSLQGIETSGFIDSSSKCLLSISAWQCDANRFAVLINSAVSDDCADSVIVLNGLIKRLQDDTADAFATTETSSSSTIKCHRFSVFREKTRRSVFIAWDGRLRPLTWTWKRI